MEQAGFSYNQPHSACRKLMGIWYRCCVTIPVNPWTCIQLPWWPAKVNDLASAYSWEAHEMLHAFVFNSLSSYTQLRSFMYGRFCERQIKPRPAGLRIPYLPALFRRIGNFMYSSGVFCCAVLCLGLAGGVSRIIGRQEWWGSIPHFWFAVLHATICWQSRLAAAMHPASKMIGSFNDRAIVSLTCETLSHAMCRMAFQMLCLICGHCEL